MLKLVRWSGTGKCDKKAKTKEIGVGSGQIFFQSINQIFLMRLNTVQSPLLLIVEEIRGTIVHFVIQA